MLNKCKNCENNLFIRECVHCRNNYCFSCFYDN